MKHFSTLIGWGISIPNQFVDFRLGTMDYGYVHPAFDRFDGDIMKKRLEARWRRLDDIGPFMGLPPRKGFDVVCAF